MKDHTPGRPLPLKTTPLKMTKNKNDKWNLIFLMFLSVWLWENVIPQQSFTNTEDSPVLNVVLNFCVIWYPPTDPCLFFLHYFDVTLRVAACDKIIAPWTWLVLGCTSLQWLWSSAQMSSCSGPHFFPYLRKQYLLPVLSGVGGGGGRGAGVLFPMCECLPFVLVI